MSRNSAAILALALASGCGSDFPQPAATEHSYTASGSSEATLSFDHFVEFQSRSAAPAAKTARRAIEDQVTYLFGPMSSGRIHAVPKGNHEISQIAVQPKDGQPGTFTARYHYAGTIALADGPTHEYTVYLPVNPKTIYAAGIKKVGTRETYPCTDEHYDSEGDFWYFWDPRKAQCPLKQGRDYLAVKARIERLANMRVSYPDYDRLPDQHGVVTIDILMGMDETDNDRDPTVSSDENAANFLALRDSLLSLGYQRKLWSTEEIAHLTGSSGAPLPYVEEFSKKTRNHQLIVRIFFGPTGIDEESRAFHFFFKAALENSSLVIYDGHSGLGGHLDLAAIEESEAFKIQPPKGRYQIYYFNSCSSYPYYNTMFFDRKRSSQDRKGTAQLDILTNGLSTYFNVLHDTNIALIRAVDAWASSGKRTSYQALARQIDSKNLFGVNGDEDNPTH